MHVVIAKDERQKKRKKKRDMITIASYTSTTWKKTKKDGCFRVLGIELQVSGLRWKRQTLKMQTLKIKSRHANHCTIPDCNLCHLLGIGHVVLVYLPTDLTGTWVTSRG